jgi:transmembrane sensor
MANEASHTGQAFPLEPIDWEAVARYLTENCTVEEAAAVRRWLDGNPAGARMVEGLGDAIVHLSVDPAADVDVEAGLRRVRARFSEPVVRPITRGLPSGVAANRGPWRRAAVGTLAAAAVILVSTLALRIFRDGAGKRPVAIAAAPRVFATPVGGRDSIPLPDGSSVILGPNSRLTVPADFGRRSRQVELNGVAYFDVRHDAARPFLVRDASALIEDVGTSFAVSNAHDGSVHVSVTSGMVRLRPVDASTSGVTLNAGDRGLLDRAGHPHAYAGAVSAEDMAWTQGRLVFRDAPLPHVALELRRWYGIDLRLADSTLANQHLTVTFEHETADSVLRVIALTLGARIERRGDMAVLHDLRAQGVPRPPLR